MLALAGLDLARPARSARKWGAKKQIAPEVGEAERAENKKKNRYPDKLPYDHNRVILNAVLNASNSDYINASTVVSVGLCAKERDCQCHLA